MQRERRGEADVRSAGRGEVEESLSEYRGEVEGAEVKKEKSERKKQLRSASFMSPRERVGRGLDSDVLWPKSRSYWASAAIATPRPTRFRDRKPAP